ncbi:hypothetical protein [Desulfosporosinus metallidurans]|uniref:Uncharacterized protein n=1 Tax=Desulfosporosinus metallidurans TaxID=1888891 RepID=A0A1Q8QRP8_9FIRM|nr:hypothetical protein [Desulfosporosinus metallidurans]OLN29938.1 hypothetical protein DSOL_3278 [Desulfosporosinus metallidurans]
MSFTDCEECEHYEDEDECLGCFHSDDWVDNFVPITPEKKEDRAKEQKRKFIASITKEEISIVPSPEFMDRLKLAWKFATKVEHENDKLFCVYCGKDYLMASDTYRLAKIEADCLEEFVGKHIVWDDVEHKLYVRPADHVSPLSDGQAQEVLDNAKGYEIKGLKSTMPFKDIPLDGIDKSETHVRLNYAVRLNKSYVNDVLDAIPDDEEIIIIHGGKLEAIRIKALGIDAVILPVRE